MEKTMLTCSNCGKASERVRACCPYAGEDGKICDTCYMNPTGPHAGHPQKYRLVPVAS